MIYANDRDPTHSAAYSAAGNMGLSQTSDPNIQKNISGHPIKHQFTSQIPTSQCMVCHMHPGTNMVATYLGMTWWDNEATATRCILKRSTIRRGRGSEKQIAIRKLQVCEGSGPILISFPDRHFRFQCAVEEYSVWRFHGHG